MDRYMIGIDSGGTKTTAKAYSLAGELLDTAVSGFGNLTVDFDKGMENICAAVDQLRGRLEVECCFLCLGCAGIETGGKKEQARQALAARYGESISVTNDAMLGLYAALEGQDGVLVIAGTGSIGYLKKEGALHRFGGWGHLINDDGSGYSIAMRAVRYVAYSFDTEKPETPLKRAIFRQLEITELRQLIDWVYRSSKGEIAALVPVVEQVAMNGDPQAREILTWAGERLAWLAIPLCRQNGIENPNIAISGSVIRKTALVNQVFRDVLKREIGAFTLFDGDFDPPKGGYYIWKEQQK